MKTSNMILIGAAAAAVYFLLRPKAAAARVKTGYDGVTEILNSSAPNTEAYGWRYFNNGVAISPNGTYYKNGVKVWSPA